jgi:peptidoglycan hydrolase-like protein with peptidoglycan-binding domain
MLVGVLVLGMVYALAESGTVAAQAPAGPQALLMGDSGEEVTRLQKRLAELYYFGGDADGFFKESTRDAVMDFQSDFGMDVNGIADPKTQSVLYAAKYRPLEKGDSGEAVKALQSRLTELEYYDGKISGNYLDGSYHAISDFQKKNGMDITGKADVKTQELLFDAGRALSKTATAPIQTPSPAVTAAPAATPTPPPAGLVSPAAGDLALTPAPTTEYTKKLQKGSKGESVKLLQAKLFELGYYMDEITGTYTSETKEAVIAFQQINGIQADGITGEKTWNMVFNNQETLEAGATPRPTPVPTPVPYAITIDVTNQVVTAYGLDENNQYTKIVRQMICSSGTYETPSSIGSWKLGSGRSRFPLFPKFNVYVQYWTPIANGMGFHSVIYNTKNTMDLSVSTYSHLGRRASHGCIRLQVADAKWIYENAGKGTVVTVTNKIPSDPELTQSLKPAPLNWKNMLPKSTPEPTAPPVYDGKLEPPQPFRSLGKGDKGADVYWLQMKLKEMGYYMGTVTGGYYGGTQKAVKAYQKDYGLTSDGVAGIKTQNLLYADVLLVSTPEVTPAP